MKQLVKCAACGEIREIRRKKNTPSDYSFWCSRCHKEVAQNLDFREKEDASRIVAELKP